MVDLGLIGGGKGAGAEDVANDGTVAGWLGVGVGLAFVQPLGGPMQELPRPPGMDYASSYGISPDGRFIVGSSSKDPDWYWVRWDRFGGDWRATSIPSGGATAVSNAGAVIGSQPVAGGATERRASLWTEQGTVVLPGVDTRPNDVNAAGTVVVGFRWQPCPSPCGQVIIVGYGYTRKDAVMRAVVWRADAQGNCGAPMRLGALDGRSSACARAQDINSLGQVVGTSAGSGLSRFAVTWQLP